MFTREALVQSDWYEERLKTRRQRDQQLWQRHLGYVQSYLSQPDYAQESARLNLAARLKHAESQFARVSASDYLQELNGCIGADRLR
jgi:hypothetical protein